MLNKRELLKYAGVVIGGTLAGLAPFAGQRAAESVGQLLDNDETAPAMSPHGDPLPEGTVGHHPRPGEHPLPTPRPRRR